MYKGNTVGVVIPAYNEGGFVGDVVREQPEFVDRIYAVDDRSTDETWDEILSAADVDAGHSGPAADPVETIRARHVIPATRAVVYDGPGRVVPIRHRENRGVGGAIKSGYLQAREDGIDVTVTMAGDGQMDPTEMTRLLDPIVLGEVDYAKGNRLTSSGVRESMPTVRFVGNALLTLLTRIASGYWEVTDPQNGYTAISLEALEAIDVEGLYEYYGFCNDLLVKLNVAGVRIADVSMKPIYGSEESGIEFERFVRKVSTMLLLNYLWRVRAQYLTHRGLAGFGVFLGATGAALAAASGTASEPTRGREDRRPAADPAVSILAGGIGIGLLLVGLAAGSPANETEVVIVDE